MTKKVLVSEKLAEAGVQFLRDRGFDVDVRLKMKPEELVEAVADYDALIVRSATQVTREVIEAATKLKIVGRAGVGVDNVDIEAATERGIVVCNAPTSNIVSAAEHTFALLLAAARNVPQANAYLKSGNWHRAQFTGVELYEKTLAIFGLGRVGGLVAERARAFGMRLVGYDPYCSPERAESLGVRLYDTLDEILPIADFITVHLPKTKETIGMFGPDEYAAMKDGVILVNTARGGIYNESSLADFIAAGKIRACGIDVWEHEPCTETPLHDFDQAIVTPHIAASTFEAQYRAGIQIAQYVAAGLTGSIVPTAVNMAPVPPEVMDAVGPYVPACQMMGKMIAQMTGEVPADLRIVAAGSISDCDLSILTAGALDGVLSHRSNAKVTPVNADAVAKRHGIKVDLSAGYDADEYASTVRLDADGTTVSCTLSGKSQTPRITSLLGYKVDIAPAANSLIFRYVDTPGRIGTIGTVLGDAGINITTMQIGTRPDSPDALVYMNVESEVTDEVLERLHEALELKNLWRIRL